MPKIAQKRTVRPKNVLVVCHGNTHRSPLAWAVLISVLGANVRSRGLKEDPKGPAAKKVREYAAKNGYDLSGHRACKVTQEDLDWATLVLYMDARNLRYLEAWPHDIGAQLRCLGEYIGWQSIPDPAYTPRGPELNRILGGVVEASLKCAEAIKMPPPVRAEA